MPKNLKIAQLCRPLTIGGTQQADSWSEKDMRFDFVVYGGHVLIILSI